MEYLQQIIDLLSANYHPSRVYLYGSHAWGQPNESSDIDLLIVHDDETPRYKREAQVAKILFDVPVPIDITVMSPAELDRKRTNPFINKIIGQGKLIYAR